MLILTRNTGENIRIGDEVTVAILDVRRNQVKIGIDAPKEVVILREELFDEPRPEMDSVQENT